MSFSQHMILKKGIQCNVLEHHGLNTASFPPLLVAKLCIKQWIILYFPWYLRSLPKNLLLATLWAENTFGLPPCACNLVPFLLLAGMNLQV